MSDHQRPDHPSSVANLVQDRRKGPYPGPASRTSRRDPLTPRKRSLGTTFPESPDPDPLEMIGPLSRTTTRIDHSTHGPAGADEVCERVDHRRRQRNGHSVAPPHEIVVQLCDFVIVTAGPVQRIVLATHRTGGSISDVGAPTPPPRDRLRTTTWSKQPHRAGADGPSTATVQHRRSRA
jgi:hypothetical protein